MGGFAPARECAAKQRLIERLRAAMDEIAGLTRRELEAAIANDQDLMIVILARLEKARQHKDLLLAQYQRHTSSHRC